MEAVPDSEFQGMQINSKAFKSARSLVGGSKSMSWMLSNVSLLKFLHPTPAASSLKLSYLKPIQCWECDLVIG